MKMKCKTTLPAVTHNMEVAAVADRIIYLKDGMIEREEYVDGGS